MIGYYTEKVSMKYIFYVLRSVNVINRIAMKNVASYKAETVLETDKRVNLIYWLI